MFSDRLAALLAVISVMCLLKSLTIYVLLAGGMVACGLQLSPQVTEAEKYVNDTYMVTCIAENYSEDTTWTGPHGPLNNTRGRVHVEIAEEDSRKEFRLIFEKITRQDRGVYTCQTAVSSSEQANNKVSFELVVVKPISFSMVGGHQNVTENRSILIKCEVFGDPTPTILWLARGKPLQGDRYKQMPGGLYISNVTLQDEGEYQCKAYQITARNSNLQTKTINLSVFYKPRWKESEGNNTSFGYVGGVANLSCEAVGKPPPDYQWTKTGDHLDPNITTTVNESKRSILMVKIIDKKVFGQYECTASNPVGAARKVIYLEEGIKPLPPLSIAVHTVRNHVAQLEVLPPILENNRLLGYRVEFTKADDDWSHTEYQDVQVDNTGNLVTIIDLNESTEYYFRVATRSESGLSNFSEQQELTTSSAFTLNKSKYLFIYLLYKLINFL